MSLQKGAKYFLTHPVSLEDMLSLLKRRIEKQLSFTFKDFTGDSDERSLIIVGFLAVLEMIKQGEILAHQGEAHTPIHIERSGVNVPHYQ